MSKNIHFVDLSQSQKKILFIPDSIWGELSGHRSSKYLVQSFCKAGVRVGIYAPTENYSDKQKSELQSDIRYYKQSRYSFYQNLFPSIIKKEFINVINDFKPDYVFYMGTIKNKVTMNICSKRGIKYSYLPLTTEYFCIKDFAALEDGPCFKCINSPLLSPIRNSCLGKNKNILNYFKEIFFSIRSKKRILNADKVVGYSHNQLGYLEDYGVKSKKTTQMPIFFDPDTINGIRSKPGDYFVMTGQNITGKGWHLIPEIIKKGTGIKYKLLMKNEDEANSFIMKNGLESYVETGEIELVIYLRTHKEILELIANSRAVLVPSYYATTGEFYLLESLGLGKPVLLFNVGIHKDVIEHKQNGLISQVGDLDNFYKNIIDIADNDVLYESLSSGAKKLFKDLTSYDKFKASLKDYFS